MNIDKTFEEIIKKLENDQRPLLKITSEDHLILKEYWDEISKNEKFENLFKILCILDNTITLSKIHEENIIQALLRASDDIKILTLGVARKHLIEAYHKDSQRLPFTFLECLKNLLKSKSPEVVEWTLRLIESLGSQALFFKNDVHNAKPGKISSMTNQHRKNSKQIIDLLERRWNIAPKAR